MNGGSAMNGVRGVARCITCSLVAVCAAAAAAPAHPGSGIVVDRQGRVFFVDTGGGVFRIGAGGDLVRQSGPTYHWLALDSAGRFAATRMPSLPQSDLQAVGSDPSLILSSDFPLAVGGDGALYFPELGTDTRLRLMRMPPSGQRAAFATLPASTADGPLRWLNGVAAGPDGAIYVTDDRAVRRVDRNGVLTTVVEGVTVTECVRPPGYDERLGPGLRGLDITPAGAVLVAATACSALLRVTPRGTVAVVLRSPAPWAPTGVALGGGDAYVLEYLHTASDDRREWLPRVKKVSATGAVSLMAEVTAR